MLTASHRRPLLAAGLALTLALAPAALVTAGPAPADNKDKAVSPAEKIKKQLDQTISLEITEQPLTLALNQIREQTKINFVIDKFTIQQMGMDPEQMPVNVKLKDVKVRTALRSALSPYNLGYAIMGDTVLISTDDMAMHRQMRQRVSVELEKVDLAAALKQLSRETATNLMLDSRVGKEAKTEVSLQMEDVPLETAVRLVAEMAGLKPVKVGNVLFVTTKTLANEMRNDPDLNQPGVNPGVMPGMPGMPGGPGMPVPGGAFPPGGGPGGIGVPIGPAAPVPGGAVPGVEKPVDPDSKPVEDKEKIEKKTDNDRGEGGPKPEPPPNKPEPKPTDVKKDKVG
jgi:hypothetical protein